MVPWVADDLISHRHSRSHRHLCTRASPTGEMIRVRATGSIRRGNMGGHVCVYKCDSEEMGSISAYAAYGTIEPLLKQAANEMRVRKCVSKATLTVSAKGYQDNG